MNTAFADRRLKFTILLTAAVMAVLSFTSCSTESTPDVNQGRLDELMAEAGVRQCYSRMDSIAFETEGLIFHADLDNTDREALMALIPDSLPGCPVSGLPYLIEDDGMELLIVCPSGHGSVEIE